MRPPAFQSGGPWFGRNLTRIPIALHAVETYNQNAAIAWPDQAEGRYAAGALLARGHRLHVTVGDDAHWRHPWDRFAAWVEVRADRLDPPSLLAALHARRLLLDAGTADRRR